MSEESTVPVSNQSNANATTSSTAYWEAVAESCVRVTLAGFAGSLVGLAKERQQQQQQPVEVLEAHPQTPKRRNHARSRPRRPPRIAIKAAASTNLPLSWSVSCMLFAVVLESCRRASPTDILWGLATTSESSSRGSDSDSRSFDYLVQRKAFTSIGDYTLGGTAAGLAGALGQRRQISRNRPVTRFGLATGLGLGLLAGTLQAAIDVGNLYLEQEQHAEEQRAREGEDEEPQHHDDQS
jgi:hypothetical protein